MSAPNKLKAPAVRKIEQAWIAGASARDLAAEHDVSHAAILYQVEGVERQKSPRMGRPRSFSHERAAALVRQGFTYAELAARFGVSKSAISQALARMEWKAAA
jgi:DNA-binding transcriptional ArsR family regulator